MKLAVTVITGFLGSGKTTLINSILSENHGKKIAIIENEFGEVGVDDGLVLQSQEEVVEMNNGCICCTVRGDLIKILHKLLQRSDPLDAIIIETTGLADPAPVAQTFFVDEYLQANMRLDGIITVVDAKHVIQHLDEEKDEGVENESVDQIAFADRIILNKLDLVSPEELACVKKRIKAINAPASIYETTHSQVPLQEILDIRAFELDRIMDMDPEFLNPDQDHQHDESVQSVGIECEGECDIDKLEVWLSALLQNFGNDIFRSKGLLAIQGSPHRHVFQGVHMMLGMGSSANGHGRPWAPGETRTNRLVFIGRNLNRKALNDSFRKCLV
eukprot:jgi/Picre1/27461/NNA_000428.t1